MNIDLAALRALEREREIPFDTILAAIETALLTAYRHTAGAQSLARVEIDFRAELRAGEEVEVRSRCSRVGTKSFDLEHVIEAKGRVVAEAKSVLVSYDYGRRESVPVPDELRARLGH